MRILSVEVKKLELKSKEARLEKLADQMDLLMFQRHMARRLLLGFDVIGKGNIAERYKHSYKYREVCKQLDLLLN